MTSNDLQNNPAFQNLSPEKLQFLMNFVGQEKTGSARDMASLLMAFSGKAKSQGIQFSGDETDFIIGRLTESMSPAERQKANMILSMFKKITLPAKTQKTEPWQGNSKTEHPCCVQKSYGQKTSGYQK